MQDQIQQLMEMFWAILEIMVFPHTISSWLLINLNVLIFVFALNTNSTS